MKSHSLAERLEEFESDLEPLNLASEPVLRLLPDPKALTDYSIRPARRTMRARFIEIRDQGLRPFRVF